MPTASSTLATLMGVIVSSTIDLTTIVFTTYWPYVLVIGIIAGLIGVFSRLTHLGTGRGK